MKKVNLALPFAMIGIGIGGFVTVSSKHPTFITVIICALVGLFIGAFISGFLNSSVLFRRFKKLDDVRGKTLDEIVSVVGDYTQVENCTITDMGNQQGHFYRWISGDENVTLLFGEDGRCVGVYNDKK